MRIHIQLLCLILTTFAYSQAPSRDLDTALRNQMLHDLKIKFGSNLGVFAHQYEGTQFILVTQKGMLKAIAMISPIGRQPKRRSIQSETINGKAMSKSLLDFPITTTLIVKSPNYAHDNASTTSVITTCHDVSSFGITTSVAESVFTMLYTDVAVEKSGNGGTRSYSVKVILRPNEVWFDLKQMSN